MSATLPELQLALRLAEVQEAAAKAEVQRIEEGLRELLDARREAMRGYTEAVAAKQAAEDALSP